MFRRNCMTALSDFVDFTEDVAEHCSDGPFDDISCFSGCEPQGVVPHLPQVDHGNVIACTSISLRSCDDSDIEDSPVAWINLWLTQEGLIYRYFLWDNPVNEEPLFEPVTVFSKGDVARRGIIGGQVSVPTPADVAGRVMSRVTEWIIREPLVG